ncbi:uncharacterized protein LOC110266861 [Arachis ipaensis]|uniref:uncharacterized protein LOC110266861 n=1 Tax=Arachis ipaensis TaxID=130454 RepID=UPI000A2B09C6|nr:uncharacterized protein LOC110266861 [Arachis ipaensis]XP_025678556.1 uncharacterized protein LOC112778457 [Arachis hypogaea]
MDQQGNWDKYLPLIEFAYNNSYQKSIRMAPYEALYRRKCQSLLCCMTRRKAAFWGQTWYKKLPNGLSTFERRFKLPKVDKRAMQILGYNPDESHILQPETVQLRADMTYQTLPVRIVERSDKQLRDKTVSLVKVAWEQTGTEEYIWMLEDKMRTDYPFLFSVAVGAAGKPDIPAMKIMIFHAYLMCI